MFSLVKNYNSAVKNEYVFDTTEKINALTAKIQELTVKNKELEEKLNVSIRKRDKKGHFLITSGKGHGKKKPIIL